MGYATPKSFHGLRSDVRFPTDFRAILHWSGDLASVEIADIANGGIRLIGTHLPNVGARVQIRAKSLDEHGYVMWRTQHSCGIMLERRINALAVVRANCFPARSDPVREVRPPSGESTETSPPVITLNGRTDGWART